MNEAILILLTSWSIIHRYKQIEKLVFFIWNYYTTLLYWYIPFLIIFLIFPVSILCCYSKPLRVLWKHKTFSIKLLSCSLPFITSSCYLASLFYLRLKRNHKFWFFKKASNILWSMIFECFDSLCCKKMTRSYYFHWNTFPLQMIRLWHGSHL